MVILPFFTLKDPKYKNKGFFQNSFFTLINTRKRKRDKIEEDRKLDFAKKKIKKSLTLSYYFKVVRIRIGI